MKTLSLIPIATLLAGTALAGDSTPMNSFTTPEPRVPRFSIDYMDRSVSPADNFYEFADGNWAKNNPVPPDKSRWASFTELAERNTWLLHSVLEDAAKSKAAPHTPLREVGDFYASAMDTNRIEKLRFKPITADLKRIDKVNGPLSL